jgi:hypothetical protein
MAGHRLIASVEQKGYSLEFWTELDESDEPIATTDPYQPCMTEVTITYTGDDPGGVETWQVCMARAANLDGSYPLLEKCLPDDDALKFVQAMDDYSSGLQIISQDDTEIVLRVLIGYPRNPSTIDSGSEFTHENGGSVGFPLLFAHAQTESGDWESQSFLVGCPEAKVVEDHSRIAFASEVTCSSSVRWAIVDKTNAGPFIRGDSPSSDGVKLDIKFSACFNLTAPGGDTDTLWEVGDDCCTDEPADQEEYDEWIALLWANFPGSSDIWAGGLISLHDAEGKLSNTVRPPRESPEWIAGIGKPVIRQRWPIMNEPVPPAPPTINRAESIADAEYGDLIIGFHRVYEVFLGTCSQYLVNTPTPDWNIAGTNGAVPVVMQENALLSGPGPLEVDVSMGTTIGTASDADYTKARIRDAVPKLTVAGCCDCCGCSDPGTPMQVRYKYVGPGADLVCVNYQSTQTNIYVNDTTEEFGGATYTYTQGTWAWEIDEDYMVATYGSGWRGRVLAMTADFDGVFFTNNPLEFERDYYSASTILGTLPCDDSEHEPIDSCVHCDGTFDFGDLTEFYESGDGGDGGNEPEDAFFDTDTISGCPGDTSREGVSYYGSIRKSRACVCNAGLGGGAPLLIADRAPNFYTCADFEQTEIAFSAACDEEAEDYAVLLDPSLVQLPPNSLTTLSGSMYAVSSADGVIADVDFDPPDPETDFGYIGLISNCYYDNASYASP